MSDLNGKVALVTGGGRGIGRAISLTLAQAGADVAVNYRENQAAAEATLQTLLANGRQNQRGMVARADVSLSGDVTRLVDAVVAKLGQVDILVNNAGVSVPKAMEDVTEADWDEVMNINLKSVFLLTQALLPAMRKKGWGRVINISSGAAYNGGMVSIQYTASKGGMEGLTRAYAKRVVTEGVTVNSVAPLLIATNPEKSTEERRKRVPMGRLGTAEEVAEAVLMLARNDFITGQTVHLNGGAYY